MIPATGPVPSPSDSDRVLFLSWVVFPVTTDMNKDHKFLSVLGKVILLYTRLDYFAVFATTHYANTSREKQHHSPWECVLKIERGNKESLYNIIREGVIRSDRPHDQCYSYTIKHI